ncbi:MAG: malonic semialdehyde reductase [Proteobacteria bacterium]|nr:MAG: malonic semialdehyde reductase [Pseudomonadota bacterium]
MSQSLNASSLDQLFRNARSHAAWKPDSVSDEQLKAIYELGKWGPTAANANPARLVFVKSPEAKEKLCTTLMGSNVEQVKAAPVTVIVASDYEFYEKLPKLYPHADARAWFAGNAEAIHGTAFRNSTLQGAYFMLAARSLGLDIRPMSGFDNAKVDELFFKDSLLKSNFIFNVGYGDEAKLFPRGPRLDFDEVAKII